MQGGRTAAVTSMGFRQNKLPVERKPTGQEERDQEVLKQDVMEGGDREEETRQSMMGR